MRVNVYGCSFGSVDQRLWRDIFEGRNNPSLFYRIYRLYKWVKDKWCRDLQAKHIVTAYNVLDAIFYDEDDEVFRNTKDLFENNTDEFIDKCCDATIQVFIRKYGLENKKDLGAFLAKKELIKPVFDECSIFYFNPFLYWSNNFIWLLSSKSRITIWWGVRQLKLTNEAIEFVDVASACE
ncbi:MAG: hypothetical protein FWH26_07860 [Oscillospiraceae bacterium]|nr:hypothetical protein [Oscillospiraceae bacterium]